MLVDEDLEFVDTSNIIHPADDDGVNILENTMLVDEDLEFVDTSNIIHPADDVEAK
ncbi:13302_t:CDS:2 [Entrophospora sp. SA101]|nr:13302_t:CDS:2 [Entrophospora sp. SA101]